MAKFRGVVRGKNDKNVSRLGHRDIQVTAQSEVADVRVFMTENNNGVVICSIIIFDRAASLSGRILYSGPVDTLLNTPHSLLEHMMFEHAQKMLMAA